MLRATILCIVSAIIVGCTAVPQLAEVVEVDPAGWFSPAEVSFIAEPSEHKVDMHLLVRYDSNISADSVEFIVTTIAPDSVRWSDRFTLHTPNNGQAIDLAESPYRRDIEWGQQGEYIILLQPQHLYRGICAVGVNIIQQE